MKIRLHEIPQEGEAFQWTRQTSEANQALADLILDADYKTDFFIRRLNSRDFELSGSIQTVVPELCSRCGINIRFPIRARFHEILIPHQESQGRTGKYGRVNHLSESEASGPSVSEYQADETFEMGEYLREQIALQIPFNPAPPINEKGDCGDCLIPVAGKSFNYDEDMPEARPESPFAALKNLKI